MAETNPFNFIAGTTVKWTATLPDYPASEWTLDYWIRSVSETLKIPTTANGTDFDAVISAAQSKNLPPGEYSWQAIVSKDDEKYPAGQGVLRVFPLLETAPTFDPRSENRKRLDAIDATLAGTASANVLEYTINGRQLRRYPVKELLALRFHYAALVAQENAVTRAKNGGSLLKSIDFVFADGGDL